MPHDADDAMLQLLLDGAEAEACRFMNRAQLPTLPLEYPSDAESEEVPSSGDPVAPDAVEAVMLLVGAGYSAVTADEAAALRSCAEVKLWPYRVGLGI